MNVLAVYFSTDCVEIHSELHLPEVAGNLHTSGEVRY